MANVKVTLSGGFHNSTPINILMPEKVAEDLKNGKVSLTDYHVLTRAQRIKLDRHFCGIKDCMCGGVSRAEIEFGN